jgi:hypothetical protein
MADNYKWGQLTWGDGNWGLQEPVTNGWGAYGWGDSEWGNNTVSVNVSCNRTIINIYFKLSNFY